jgi:hypothetical protein
MYPISVMAIFPKLYVILYFKEREMKSVVFILNQLFYSTYRELSFRENDAKTLLTFFDLCSTLYETLRIYVPTAQNMIEVGIFIL